MRRWNLFYENQRALSGSLDSLPMALKFCFRWWCHLQLWALNDDVTFRKALDDDVTFKRVLDDDITFRRALHDDITFKWALDDDVTFRKALDDDVTFIWALDDDVTIRRALDDDVTFRRALDDEVTFRRASDNDNTFRIFSRFYCILIKKTQTFSFHLNQKVSVIFILSESKSLSHFNLIIQWCC